MNVRRPFRGWIVLWAVLQFALPTFATYADALLEKESATAFAHAESRSDSSCRAVHSAECALCQAVQRAGTPEREVTLPPCAQQVQIAHSALATQSHAVVAEGRPSPRAPPAA